MFKEFCSIVICCFLGVCAYAQVITLNGEGIGTPGSWYCFRNTVTLDDKPETVELAIAADSKYWLWINGELQVREGGLKRGPNSNDTYRDVLTSLPALKQGDNTIAILVWYFGKDGFSHKTTPTPGITFDLKVNGCPIVSATSWKTKVHPAYYLPEGEEPNYRLPESNIGFDANRDIPFTITDYDDSGWEEAVILSLEEAGWNHLVDRPIPLWKDYGLKPYARVEQKADTMLYAHLPYNAQVTPFLRVKAESGKRIRILTDNYRGGSATNVFAEYVTKGGEQSFECRGWMNGHTVIYYFPKGVEVLNVKYRETGYDTSFSGSFVCDDPMLNTLWNKAQRTLYITMRDTYMDCPDRERAQWWGDVVNELGEAFYALDEKAHLLTRKGIRELMDWQHVDSTIYAPIPSGNYDSELPMQMLASISYYGFWTYYMGTGDRATIEYVYPKVKKYIHVWKTDEQGLVIPRKGGWTWGDWGDNKDMTLLFNQWYIIALMGYQCMAELVGDMEEADWAATLARHVREAFHATYWNGQYYISPDYEGEPDDRAQALAVVSGTLPQELYPVLRPFFSRHFHASPYMEKYVLQALCRMGCHQDALNRMKLRYAAMINSPLTTLWEGWGIGAEGFGGGSYNHAWSGGPLTILCQYIAGIETLTPAFETFRVNPHPAHLNHIRAIVPLSGKREIRMTMDKDQSCCYIELEVPQGTTAHFQMPIGYVSMRLNGEEQDVCEKTLPAGKWSICCY